MNFKQAILGVLSAAAFVVGPVSSVSALTYTFYQADLLGFSVFDSSGYGAAPGDPSLGIATTYGDAVAMTGVAGANDFLLGGGYVYFGETFTSTTFNAGDVLSIAAFNDNNQGWDLDIWYSTNGTAGGIVRSPVTSFASGTSGILSISLAGVTAEAWGVSVHNILTPLQGDQFHASWSAVPLPAALPLFVTAMGGLGAVGAWRRRRAAKQAA